MRSIEASGLFWALNQRDAELHSRALAVRQAVTSWLEYVPATFPHYTRHTVGHSDNIVWELSSLLALEGSEPQANLNAVELYILIASAYLHDAGMVVADAEKALLMQTGEWRAFIDVDGAGRSRWREIEKLRSRRSSSQPEVSHFLADVQLRFLLAEFVRRTHHLRGRQLLQLHEREFGDFSLGDPLVLRTITAVCVGHGLPAQELEGSSEYPERRLVLHEEVNVRFLSILLRLGDLLDLSTDRACPLLLQAASPLPADSYAHWSQYQRITHRLTAPDRVDVTAECRTQEEHRFLADWAAWLVAEAKAAGWLMTRAARHGEWSPPRVETSGSDPTIVSRPAEGATYLPKEWELLLDEQAVVDRLVTDTYPGRLSFVRELIQNAADACRCRMFLDLERDGEDAPASPTHVKQDRRDSYSIRVQLGHRLVTNELSGETERRHVVSVSDNGVGMTIDRIRHYFLQVGRSFYRSEEFRRNYAFEPGSRFGLGFLSVFSASDDVMVDTLPADADEEAIRLTLTGVRQYLLTERGLRDTPGTSIEVTLRENVDADALVRAVESWCRLPGAQPRRRCTRPARRPLVRSGHCSRARRLPSRLPLRSRRRTLSH